MFRRRRVQGADHLPPSQAPDDLPRGQGDEDAQHARDSAAVPGPGGATAGAGSGETTGPGGGMRGPWDVTDHYPQHERIDFGSLRVPAGRGLDVRLQVNVSGDQALAVLLVRGDSAMQLQAFAAPKRTGLWDDVRRELIEDLTAAGGRGEEREGPFGTEVQARVPPEPGATAQRSRALQPARFLGADGPRWFLRGLISGPAAAQSQRAKVFEDVFADTVVVRGEHPMPPRDLLELRLPPEAQRALEEQMGQMTEAPGGREPLNLFQRGPEITETR